MKNSLPLNYDNITVFDEMASNKATGYSFITDHRNLFQKQQLELLKHILCSGTLRDQMIQKITEDNVIVWQSSEQVTDFLKACHQLLEQLLFLIIMVAGMCPRAAEITTFRVSNSEYGTLRSLFWMKNILK